MLALQSLLLAFRIETYAEDPAARQELDLMAATTVDVWWTCYVGGHGTYFKFIYHRNPEPVSTSISVIQFQATSCPTDGDIGHVYTNLPVYSNGAYVGECTSEMRDTQLFVLSCRKV